MSNCPKCRAAFQPPVHYDCGSLIIGDKLSRSSECHRREALALAKRFSNPRFVIPVLHEFATRMVKVLTKEGERA